MNKKIWIIVAIVILLAIGIGIFLYTKNSSSVQQENTYEADKTSTQKNTSIENNTNTEEQREGILEAEQQNNSPVEEQIATYTTKIYSKDSARQNNISITCNTLNGTIIKSGQTFSFCGTVGQASSSKGYQEADIFDKNGNKKKGFGGRKLSN